MPSIKIFGWILLFSSSVIALPVIIEDSIQCQNGKAQSPIFVDPFNTTFVSYRKFSFSSDYRRSTNFDILIEVGKTLSLTLTATETRTLTLTGGCLEGEFTFQRAHLHWPQSEHQFTRNSFITEAHFVHKNLQTNQTAVLAYFFQSDQTESNEEESNNDWNRVIERMNKTTNSILLTEGLTSLMQGNVNRFFHYRGSLTTSPCTEGVLWVLISSQIKLSNRSIQQLQEKIITSNYRKTQPLNGRNVTRSFPSASSW